MHHLRWALTEVVGTEVSKLFDLGVDACQAGFKGTFVEVFEVVVLTPD